MNENTLVIQTPAKVNLSLDITGKRADGYHTLRSVFQTISLYDTLIITRTDKNTPFSLTCDTEGIPCDASNLVTKAAIALLGAHPCGVKIHLQKKIPSQAGMGGGSSDCAAALLGIRRILGLAVSHAALHDIATSLGADVPFFLLGGTVLAEGIGDQLTPLVTTPERILVVAKGTEGISTPDAYRQIDALQQPLPTYTDAVMQHLYGDANALFDACGNAFDAVAENAEICTIRQVMRKYGANPVLSGSGAAVFCGMTDMASAQSCIAALQNAGLPLACIAHTTAQGIITKILS